MGKCAADFAPQPSACLFVLPIFTAMAVVGFFSCGNKSALSVWHWRRAALLCLVDLGHQVLEKGNLNSEGDTQKTMSS